MPQCPKCHRSLAPHVQIPDKPQLFSCLRCGRTFQDNGADDIFETTDSQLVRSDFRDARRNQVKADAVQERLL